MNIGKTLRRAVVASALAGTAIVATAVPAQAASATVYLDWGNSLAISSPIAANSQRRITVTLVPDGDREASWKVIDTVTGKSVGSGQILSRDPITIGGLYGKYRLLLSCAAVIFPTCSDGGTIKS